MALNEPHDAPETARFSEVQVMKFRNSVQAPVGGCESVSRGTSQRRMPGNTLGAAVLFVVTLLSMPARAADGCTVLLCLAAPSWPSIAQCVPPVRQVLRDLAIGKPFPTCAMAGVGNTASHAWSAAPAFCPPQYTRAHERPSGTFYTCDYDGAISVFVSGALFSQTWWSMGGDSVTDFSAAAKQQLGTWDQRFDAEYAAWLASQPDSTPPQN